MDGELSEPYHIAQGNQLAFDSFMDRHGPRLYHHAYGILGNREQAEEVVSDVFLEAWKQRAQLSRMQSIVAWLNTIVYRRAVSVRRRERRQQTAVPIDELADFFFPQIQPASPVDSLISAEDSRLLNEAISQLPPRCRHVFFLAKVEQMSYADIARMLDISEATVNYHVTYALSQLRRQLRRIV